MLQVLVRCVLAAVLAGSAFAKLARPRTARAALATFDLRGSGAGAAWGTAIAVELVLAGGVAAGLDAAAAAAAVVLSGYAVLLAVALRRGRAGAPCGCFGARSRVSPAAVARTAALALAFAAVPFIPDADPSPEAWLASGLAVALLAIAGLGVAVLALAREVGGLRLAIGPQAALEIPHEGPEIGSATALVGRFRLDRRTRLALAVFTSKSCHLCRSLEPAVRALAADPVVAVERFDEAHDAEAWRALDVPGSPYAVALGLDGTVLAKGTFNSYAQLESVLASAERRTEPAHG